MSKLERQIWAELKGTIGRPKKWEDDKRKRRGKDGRRIKQGKKNNQERNFATIFLYPDLLRIVANFLAYGSGYYTQPISVRDAITIAKVIDEATTKHRIANS